MNNHSLNMVAHVKTLLTPRRSLNAFTEPHPSRTLELEKNVKSGLPILLVVVNGNCNITFTR